MINLDIPYLSQLDNNKNPYGSCNVTSAAMALKWAGVNISPDTLYQEMLDKGLSRHSPYDLAVMIENKGAIDTFLPNANIQDIKEHIKEGNPVIVHGYFTGFGHIIVIKGFDDHNFICHDPYGEWYSSGYQINGTKHYGKDIKYSFNLIQELCDENGIWTHFCESKGVNPPPRPAVTPRYQGMSLQDIFHDDLSVTHSEIFNVEVRINFQIQVTLGERYEGRRDAIFGPKTQKALNSYCQEIGLPADPIQKPLAKLLIEGKAKLR
jgi:hypothetical protein